MKSSLGFITLLFCSGALAVQPYCQSGYKPISSKDLQLDLSKFNSEITSRIEEQTPPSTTITLTQFNLCDPLPVTDNSKADEVCSKGSYICRKTIHRKGDTEAVNIVQDIASDADGKLIAEFKPVNVEADATKNGYQYTLVLNGGKYNGNSQSAVITLECDESQSRSDAPKAPGTVIYTNNNVLTVHWKTVFACATKVGEKVPDNKDKNKQDPPKDDKSAKGMSGIGIFFTIVFVLLGVYFVGGAFYNFKMYNARGLDLIPHRDFWFDLPYLIKDLLSHIVDSVMSRRRGGGGYVAV